MGNEAPDNSKEIMLHDLHESYEYRFYCQYPIYSEYKSWVSYLEDVYEKGSAFSFQTAIQYFRNYVQTFESAVKNAKFANEIDVSHISINGKRSHLANSIKEKAVAAGYIKDAAIALSNYFGGGTYSFGWVYANQTNSNPDTTSSEVAQLIISTELLHLLRNFFKHTLVPKAYQDILSKEQIHQASNLPKDSVKTYIAQEDQKYDIVASRLIEIIDYDFSGFDTENIPITPFMKAPSSNRAANKIVESTLGGKDELKMLAHKLFENLILEQLRYKNVEIVLQLSHAFEMSDQIDLALIPLIIDVLDDQITVQTAVMLAEG